MGSWGIEYVLSVDFGLGRAPDHASRRSTNVRRPSFQLISCFNASLLFLFLDSNGWATESGLSNRYGSGTGFGGEYDESESRSRHSCVSSNASSMPDRGCVDGRGHSQFSFSFALISLFALWTSASCVLFAMGFRCALGRESGSTKGLVAS